VSGRVLALGHQARAGAVLLLVLVAWQLGAGWADTTVLPSPTAVIGRVRADGLTAYLDPLGTTLVEAGLGFLFGTAAAVALGVLAIRFRFLLPPVTQVATLTYTVPTFAVGAVLVTVMPTTAVRVTISALYVVFTTVVGVVSGMQNADRASLDVVTAAGGGSWRQLWSVRLPAGLPSFFAALQIGAPSALLGAVVAEYIGGSGGIGVAMLGAQRNSDVQRTWGLALAVTAASLLAYALVGLVGRLSTTWATSAPGAVHLPSAAVPTLRRRLLTGAGQGLLVAVLAIGGWWLLLRLLDVNAFVARTPAQVWSYLTGAEAGAARGQLLQLLGTTLGHMLLGLVAGVLLGVLVASAFTLVPVVQRVLLPIALLVQSVPIVAFLPLALLVFGRGAGVATLIAGLVAFFPTMVNVCAALRSTPAHAIDLLTSVGAGSVRCLVTARLPYAAPAIFASIRIAAPAAFSGALLVEWLALGNGLGGVMSTAAATYGYDELWSAVALGSVASIAVAAIAKACQRSVARRMSLAVPAL
jgi:sulfonate transport system permease protein